MTAMDGPTENPHWGCERISCHVEGYKSLTSFTSRSSNQMARNWWCWWCRLDLWAESRHMDEKQWAIAFAQKRKGH